MPRSDIARLNIRITRTAYLRLEQARKDRERTELGRVPHGRIVTELIMACLEPTPAEENASAPRKTPRRATTSASMSALG